MKKPNRKAEFIIMVGTNGTGKSTIMKKFLPMNERNLIIPANGLDEAWLEIPKLECKPVFIGKKIDHYEIPGLNSFRGTRQVVIYDEKMFDAICHPENGYMNGGLFMDDFKNYIPTKGTLPANVNRLFSDRRHKMLDIFAATHSYQKINADMFDFEPTILQFKTTRPLTDYLSDKIMNFEELKVVFDRVNEKSEKNAHYFEIFETA